MHILMVAAENGALPGFKVGGVADVVRELPLALAAAGCRVSVVCPSYGLLAQLAPARAQGVVEADFRGARTPVAIWRCGANGDEAVRHFVLDHALFSSCGVGAIYCDDTHDGPFASDASKFALFCSAVAEAQVRGVFGTVDVIHLHDWHAALLALLRRYHSGYTALRRVRTVYTIHNLALQGVRPLRGDPSSLEHWFPRLLFDQAAVSDPRWPDCVNPMAAAIRLADAVGTVSPSYAREILEPNAVLARGLHGGEGLEQDLRAVHARGALAGILNGCEYPRDADGAPAPPIGWPQLVALMRRENLRMAGARSELHSAHFVAQARLATLARKRPRTLLVTVGRITQQKLGLLRAVTGDGRSVLDAVLDTLGEDGQYLMLGSGEADLEQFLISVSARRGGLIVLRGYTESLPDALYAAGDLFLMPSTYEPCGISQMLAMRAGQPCLVHAVGGLKDTVRDDIDGFAFGGESTAEQAQTLLARLRAALDLRARHPRRWAALREAAASARFRWSDSAREYLQRLYGAA
jgi:starch synthase